MNKLVNADTEKLNHFISKSIMFYILSELDHDIVTECNVVDVIIIDLTDLPDDIFQRYLKLREYVIVD